MISKTGPVDFFGPIDFFDPIDCFGPIDPPPGSWTSDRDEARHTYRLLHTTRSYRPGVCFF